MSFLRVVTGLLLFILRVYGNHICEDVNTENDCLKLREDGLNCYYDPATLLCITFACGSMPTEASCQAHSDEFFCEWKIFKDTLLGAQLNPNSGDLPLCYSECPKNLDIVFIVDTSNSIVEANEENPEIFGNFIIAVMDTWWKMQEQLNLTTEFGMVSFNTEVKMEFDLNTRWELDEYIEFVDDFFIPSNFGGQTNTLGAFWKSLEVFQDSEHHSDEQWQRMAIMVTDGVPTIVPDDPRAVHGPNPCQDGYHIKDSFIEENIFLWSALVSVSQTYFIECFDATRSRFSQIDDFNGLETLITQIIGGIDCHTHTSEPTTDPTDIPTSDPTIYPTEIPTFDPTEDPTEDPSIIPTWDPTWNPTDNPSWYPTEDPTEKPTWKPTKKPTHRSWWHPQTQWGSYSWWADAHNQYNHYDGYYNMNNNQHWSTPNKYEKKNSKKQKKKKSNKNKQNKKKSTSKSKNKN